MLEKKVICTLQINENLEELMNTRETLESCVTKQYKITESEYLSDLQKRQKLFGLCKSCKNNTNYKPSTFRHSQHLYKVVH